MSKNEIIQELAEYSELKDNWDYDGASKGDESSLLDAIQFVNIVPEKMLNGASVCLHLHGKYSIDWNWAVKDAPMASLEFLGNGRISLFAINNGMKAKGIINIQFGKEK